MEKDKTSSRLSALDGLRGFAIILVFLNHINTAFISPYLSPYLFGWIFADGVTGVTFLFILSGFLMSYLYPNPPSPLAFLQKRYTRIFPLFLTMCSVMMMYRLNPHASWFYFISIILVFAIITHILWVYVIKKLPPRAGNMLFISFLFIQVITGAYYLLWIMRHPPLFFSQFPYPLHEAVIGLVNATLTLPLGDYIPMIDGVYWTLVAEVLFYILYPFLFSPLARYISTKRPSVQIAFVLSLLPFFGGIQILSQRIFGLHLLQLELFYYFVTGITLGTIYKNRPEIITSFSAFFTRRFYVLPLVVFLLTLASVHAVGVIFPSFAGPWIRLLFAIPLTGLVTLLLDNDSILAKIGSKKTLVFIGTISYSIYLSHAIIIHVFEKIYTPTDTLTNIVYLFSVFLVDALVASGLFYLLEKPYFTRSHESKAPITVVERKLIKNPRYILGTILLLYIFSLLMTYQSTLNFFSISDPIDSTHIRSPLITENSITLTKDNSLTVQFTATENKLGIITMQVKHKKPDSATTPQSVLFSLKELSKNTVIATSSYEMRLFDDAEIFPFGFPQILDSKGKTYIVEIAVNNPDSLDTITIDKHSISAVYPVNKMSLLKHPSEFIHFMEVKLLTIVTNPEALFVLLLSLPLAVLLVV